MSQVLGMKAESGGATVRIMWRDLVALFGARTEPLFDPDPRLEGLTCGNAVTTLLNSNKARPDNSNKLRQSIWEVTHLAVGLGAVEDDRLVYQ